MANTLTQFGITWTFDKQLSLDGAGDTYLYGQFANGDYWVKGPINIISITPATAIVDGRSINGSMINPDQRLDRHGRFIFRHRTRTNSFTRSYRHVGQITK